MQLRLVNNSMELNAPAAGNYFNLVFTSKTIE